MADKKAESKYENRADCGRCKYLDRANSGACQGNCTFEIAIQFRNGVEEGIKRGCGMVKDELAEKVKALSVFNYGAYSGVRREVLKLIEGISE